VRLKEQIAVLRDIAEAARYEVLARSLLAPEEECERLRIEKGP
jgi:hypothetical protein